MSWFLKIFKKSSNTNITKEKSLVHDLPVNKPKARLIPDLENIVAEYLDVHDYAKLIRYNSKVHSWEKYFKGKLPDIHQAINVYDNLDLVKYIVLKTPPREFDLKYEKVEFKSVSVAKYITTTFPFLNEYDYELSIKVAIKSENLELLVYLFQYIYIENLIYTISEEYLGYVLLSGNLEITKIILEKFRKIHDSKEYIILLRGILTTAKRNRVPLTDKIKEYIETEILKP